MFGRYVGGVVVLGVLSVDCVRSVLGSVKCVCFNKKANYYLLKFSKIPLMKKFFKLDSTLVLCP